MAWMAGGRGCALVDRADGQGVDGVGAGVGLRDLDAEVVVGVGVPVVGERHHDDDGVVEEVGGGQGGADQRDGGEGGGAVAREDEQQARAEVAHLLDLGRPVSASVTGTTVRPACCSRTCRGGRYRRRKGPYCACVSAVTSPVAGTTRASGQALRVDELDLLGASPGRPAGRG